MEGSFDSERELRGVRCDTLLAVLVDRKLGT